MNIKGKKNKGQSNLSLGLRLNLSKFLEITGLSNNNRAFWITEKNEKKRNVVKQSKITYCFHDAVLFN